VKNEAKRILILLLLGSLCTDCGRQQPSCRPHVKRYGFGLLAKKPFQPHCGAFAPLSGR
jgi:hypothetical protein